jgi:hypothetical protein
LFIGMTVFLALSCDRNPTQPFDPSRDRLLMALRIADNKGSSLSAVAAVQTFGRGQAAIEILGERKIDEMTPYVSAGRGSSLIPVLGLRSNRSYALRALFVSTSGRESTSEIMSYNTPPLPDDMPAYIVLKSDHPTVKNIMLGITPSKSGRSYAVIIDTGGSPVWYKEFKDAVVDFQRQANGRYTAWSSIDGSPAHFYEFDPLGEITNEYSASNGLTTDPHEFRMRGDSYALFGTQIRTTDLRPVGGLPQAAVQGFVVEYHTPGRNPLFWNTFDHFSINDAAPDVSLIGQNVDPWHGNAIEIDFDGNLLASFRNSDEITKINSRTGEIIWRLGGKNNQFTFLDDAMNGFSHQHGIRRLENGDIILFDDGNLHSPPSSRAVEYKLDETRKTAQLVWEYRPNPAIFGFALGFAQRLANGNTLICFGTAQRILEVTFDGKVRWDIQMNETQRFAYRAIAIESLY